MNNNKNKQKAQLQLLGGIAMFTLASYLRWASTGSIKVDGNYLSGAALYVNLLLVLFGIGLSTFAYIKIIFQHQGYQLSVGETKRLGYLSLLVASPMLPMLSNDIFSFFAYGDLVVQGINPYIDGTLLKQSAFFDLVGEKYKETICVYGPVNLLLSYFAVLLAGSKLPLAFVIVKLVFLAVGLGFIALITKIYQRFETGRYNTLALVILSPILWCQCIGQNHTDMVGALFLALAMWFMLEGKTLLAVAAIALALVAKFSFIYLLPMPLVYLWWQNKSAYLRIAGNSLAAVALTVGIIVLLYLPFPSEGTYTPLLSFQAVSGLRPSGTISDVIGEILGLLISSDAKVAFWAISVPALKVTGLLLAAYTGLRIFKLKNLGDVYTLFAILGAILLTIFTHRFFSWYLMLIVPLFLLTKNRAWVAWLAVLSSLSITMDFMHLPSAESALFPVLVAVPAFAVCLVFLWRFKARYRDVDFTGQANLSMI